MSISQSNGVNSSAGAIANLQEAQFRTDGREARELAALPRLLEGCDRFIDVGANIGQYMFFANRWLFNAEILGIEANPRLLPIIDANCRRAEQEAEHGNKFVVENCAIVDGAKEVDFFVDPLPDRS